jgi:hypothetical protein
VVEKSGETLLQSLGPMPRSKHMLVAQAKETYGFSMYPQCKDRDVRALERVSGVGSRECLECRGRGSIGVGGFI